MDKFSKIGIRDVTIFEPENSYFGFFQSFFGVEVV